MAQIPNDDSEQLSFSFYEEMAPRNAAREQDFETEDDALDALLGGSGSEPETAVPHPLECDCCCAVNVPDPVEKTNTPLPEDQPSGERVLSSSEPEDRPPFDADNMEPDAGEVLEKIEEAAEDNRAEADPGDSVIVVSAKKTPFPPLNEQTIRRAAAGFLASLNPDGIAVKFSSGIPRLKIDAGAYFMTGGKMPKVSRTILAVTGVDRDKCWIDVSEKESLLAMLAEAKAEKGRLEEMLKEKEPYLKDDSLFPEAQTWDFARTKNRKYHTCLHKIEKIESSIYHGSKFERMMFEKLADEFYLIVPENLISAEELPPEWGLVYIAEDFSANLVRKAQKCDCPDENRMSFALHAATSVSDSFLLANGISVDDGAVKFYLPPKRRKAYC